MILGCAGRIVKWNVVGLLIFLMSCACWSAQAAAAKIVKVHPHYLDSEGRRALSPSLYERDAYQAQLRKHPEERSGLRFSIQWKATTSDADRSNLKLRLEIRGSKSEGRSFQIERPVKPKRWFSSWSALTLQGNDYQRTGEVVAWRVSLWNGEQLLAEEKSFLW